MSKNNRLFLLAGYSAQNIIDTSLILLIQKISECGDIILVMDNDVPQSELDKISRYVIYSSAKKHGEYDFGSYKRAYTYARDTKILSEYEFVYLINDSVYGPLYEIKPYLEKMESFDTPAFGLVCNPSKNHPHIQSWFIGMRNIIFMSEWFNDFILSVTHQTYKSDVTELYEDGFTNLVTEHGLEYKCIYSAPGRSIYNKVKRMYLKGMPFIKKNSFVRHNGALGGQIHYILNHVPKSISLDIIDAAKKTYGEKYINWLLKKNPIRMMIRSVSYSIKKIISGNL